MDAFEKVMRLQLKAQQERDIVSVLLYCLGQEKHFNPFYAHLASRLCAFVPSIKFTMKLAVWDHLKALAQGDEKAIKAHKSIAHLVATLLGDNSLPITTLKQMEVEAMDKWSESFYEELMVHLLAFPPNIVRQVFSSLLNITQRKEREAVSDQLQRFLKIVTKKVERGDPNKYAYTGVDQEHLIEASKMARLIAKGAKGQKGL